MVTPAVQAAISQPPTQLKLGICGHPVHSYWGTSIATQIDRIVDLRLKSYRVNVDRADGTSVTKLGSVISAAAAKGIEVLPVIVPSDINLDAQSEASAYAAAYKLANALAVAFPNVPTWECGNEQEVYALVRGGEIRDNGAIWEAGWGDSAGYDVNDYLAARYNKVRGLIKGLIAGIRSASSARCMVGTSGWFHYGFLKRLLQDGVNFDVVAHHWYSEMGDPTDADPYFTGEHVNVLAELQKLGKPIQFTEFNKRDGSRESQGEHADWLGKFITKLETWAPIYNIEAAHIYELLDEPGLGVGNGEAYYGLLTINGSGAIVAEKTAYQVVKSRTSTVPDPRVPDVIDSRIPDLVVSGPAAGSTFVDTVTSNYSVLFDVTVSIKPTAVTFLMCNNANYTGFQVGRNKTPCAAYYNNVQNKAGYTGNYVDTRTTRIGFVFSGGVLAKIFIGTGPSESIKIFGGGSPAIPTGSVTWKVGRASGPGYDFRGKINRIRIWRSAIADDVMRGIIEAEA